MSRTRAPCCASSRPRSRSARLRRSERGNDSTATLCTRVRTPCWRQRGGFAGARACFGHYSSLRCSVITRCRSGDRPGDTRTRVGCRHEQEEEEEEKATKRRHPMSTKSSRRGRSSQKSRRESQVGEVCSFLRFFVYFKSACKVSLLRFFLYVCPFFPPKRGAPLSKGCRA